MPFAGRNVGQSDPNPVGLQVRKPPEIVECPKCRGSFFERLELAQYQRTHLVIPGQSPPIYGMEYIILRCARCQELLEPTIELSPRDLATSQYGELVKELEDESWRSQQQIVSKPEQL